MSSESNQQSDQRLEKPRNLPEKIQLRTQRILGRRQHGPHGPSPSSSSTESHGADLNNKSLPTRTSYQEQTFSSLPEAVNASSNETHQQRALSIEHNHHPTSTDMSGASVASVGPVSVNSQPFSPIPSTPTFSHTTNPVSPLTTRTGTVSSLTVSSQTRSPFTPPITSPPRNRSSQMLLINPTSTLQLTNIMLATLRPILPPQLEVVGYTAPYPAPTANESTVDTLVSSEIVLRDLSKYATNNGETVQNFDGLLVASYNKHPLIDALRESFDVPVIGIMEGSLYVSRMLGSRFGILATTNQHLTQIQDAVRSYGLESFYVGSELVNLSTSQITSSSYSSINSEAPGLAPIPSPEELLKRITQAAQTLALRGADTIILGSEVFSAREISRAAKDAIREQDGRRTINVIDSVEAGMLCLNSLVGMGVPTSKKGVYRSERDIRRARGQTWL